MITDKSITYHPCEIETMCKSTNQKYKIAYSMRDYLAKKNANQLWGSGYKFDSPNEQILKAFNDFAQENRLIYLLKFIERELSLHGRVILVLNQTKGGKLKINVANPFFYSAIGKVFVNDEIAVLWQRVVLDNGTWYVKSTYDKFKCKNEIFDDSGQMIVYDAQHTIAQELQIVPVWNHNLGFVPVIQLTNYPIFEYTNIMFSPESYTQITDWFDASFLETSFYELFVNLNKEVAFCHSRIGIENANQQLIEKLTSGSNEKDILGDYIIETEVGGKLQAIPGVGDFTKYTSAMNEIMDFYCKFANSSKFSEGGGAQKTSAEANSSNSSQIELIYSKKSHREWELSDFIAKVLAALGLVEYWSGEYDFTFSINVNIDKNDNAYLDAVIKKIQAGLISIPIGISELYGISLEKAEKMFESIKAFNEENNVVTSTMMGENEMDSFASDGFDEGGKPPVEKE